jgi:hypothetical protein
MKRVELVKDVKELVGKVVKMEVGLWLRVK